MKKIILIGSAICLLRAVRATIRDFDAAMAADAERTAVVSR